MIARDPAMQSVIALADQVAPSEASLLITGESGVGKEVMARYLHAKSRRSGRPFISVNCAAIPENLLESELFGHEKGAFTGAMQRRPGRFELADGGTLFLDEIGDMALDLQVKLLRVLQEQAFERLGSTHTSRVNVRVVAATHRDLLRMVDAKEFRADLYYRLSVFPIAVPPLRERRGDIPALTRFFVAKYSRRMNRIFDEIPAETTDAMVAYDWPGNIRQLQNFIEHGVIVSKGNVFQPALNQLHSRPQAASEKPSRTLEEATRNHILQVLEETRWVVGGNRGAAAKLGVARTTLLSKMRRLGIESLSGDARQSTTSRGQAFATVA
jgi:formate hydrogenlyase transcriptional activator